MALLVGIVGAIAGATIGILLTEVVFASSQGWPDIVPFVLAVLGWLAARELLRQRRSRRVAGGSHAAGA